MSQRDCGCPGLVTPTLDELLAVARNKPLPRVRVRERRPPPARVGATLKGWLEWRLIDRRGREVRGGEGPNLILDQGLDAIASTELLTQQGSVGAPATYFPIIRYAAVGTDSSTPAASDTGLGSELARTDATFATETITRPSPGVYQMTRYIEFDYDEANGVLAEWGFSSSASAGSNLFNRALFLDGGGSPDAITKTDQEKLRLTYTLEVTLSPTSMTAGSFTLDGVGAVNGDYMLVGGPAPSGISDRGKGPDLLVFSALARGTLNTASAGFVSRPTGSASVDGTDRSAFTYTGTVTPAANTTNDVIDEQRDAYTPGAFTREGGAWAWDTAVGNLDPIRAVFLNGAANVSAGGDSLTMRVGYVFAIDGGDAFEKDNEHRLVIGVPTVTWGRAP